MSRLRVLVVEDSITVRKRLCEVLSADAELDVVGEAEDGHQAIAQCLALRPDVVTMDMVLPRMTGLAATEYIMAHCPTPILVVSSFTNRGELFSTLDALAAGAVDVIDKPNDSEQADDRWVQRLLVSVKMVARIRVITHLRAKLPSATLPAHPFLLSAQHDAVPCQLMAMGASTGGPGAIVQVLQALPKTLPVPMLIVQHIGDDFGVAFADWLNTQTPLPARYAKDGEPLGGAAGCVVLAPPNRHMVVEQGRLRLTDGLPRHSCRPSVDHLFQSIAQDCGAGAVACLLTGMGRDGASGLQDIRRAGGHTIAQDEASCVIYGMPREAVRLDAAVQVLPLNEIGPALAARIAIGQRRHA